MSKDISSALVLLQETRDFIDAIPRLALLNAPRRTGRRLVERIDRLLSVGPWREAPEDAVKEARQRWQNERSIRIDDGAFMRGDARGLWISAWLLLEYRTAPIEVDSFKRALESLPLMPREVYQLHRADGLPLAEIAQRLGLSAHEVEAFLFEALRGLHACIYGQRT